MPIVNINIEVFKQLTLLNSIIKLDFILNIFFLLTGVFFMHNDDIMPCKNKPGEEHSTCEDPKVLNLFLTIPFYGFFLILTVTATVVGVVSIRKRESKS